MDTRGLRVEDDETTSVRTWLEDVQIVDGEVEPGRVTERQTQSGSKKSAPYTPPRRPQLVDKYEEVSPTDTTFSHGSVFSSSHSTPASPLSPISPTHINSKAQYPETDASSICGGEVEGIARNKDSTGLLLPQVVPHGSRPASLNSYDPPSKDEDVHLAESLLDAQNGAVAAPIESIAFTQDTPWLTWITSCLQCTLAGLPCSRTPPACSRCQRNGYGEICLLQRRRTRREMVNGNGMLNTAPVLLTLHGSDETVYTRKVELTKEVCCHSIFASLPCALLARVRTGANMT